MSENTFYRGNFEDSDDIRGLSTSGYNPNATCVQQQVPEIINSISRLTIEPEVISRAISIYHQINADPNFVRNRPKTIKGSKKDQLIFLCVFRAYYELERASDICWVADLVGLPRNIINQALEMYPMKFEPENFVPFYIDRFNQILKEKGSTIQIQPTVINEVIQIINDCRETQIGREGIQNMPIKGVAVATLYFYLTNIVNVMKQEYNAYFTDACNISWTGIRKYYDLITIYYNSVSFHQPVPATISEENCMSNLMDTWLKMSSGQIGQVSSSH